MTFNFDGMPDEEFTDMFMELTPEDRAGFIHDYYRDHFSRANTPKEISVAALVLYRSLLDRLNEVFEEEGGVETLDEWRELFMTTASLLATITDTYRVRLIEIGAEQWGV